jgi:hypothetical protein
MVPSAITRFWCWFATRQEQFSEWLNANLTLWISEEMDPKMKEFFPEIGWEIGPGENDLQFLAFTLNGDLSNIDLVREILRLCPQFDNWEFRAGRPRRQFSKLTIHNEIGQEVQLDLDCWRYVLTEFDHGRFYDIAVATSQTVNMDASAEQFVLTTAVQCALGEICALKYIDRLEFIDNPNRQWEQRSTAFKLLAAHIDSLTRIPK